MRNIWKIILLVSVIAVSVAAAQGAVYLIANTLWQIHHGYVTAFKNGNWYAYRDKAFNINLALVNTFLLFILSLALARNFLRKEFMPTILLAAVILTAVNFYAMDFTVGWVQIHHWGSR